MRKTEGLTENLAGNELFIYAASGEQLLVLNRTALFIWSMCNDHSEEEMLPVLEKLFPDADRSRLSEDIRDSLRMFVEHGLLVQDERGSTIS